MESKEEKGNGEEIGEERGKRGKREREGRGGEERRERGCTHKWMKNKVEILSPFLPHPCPSPVLPLPPSPPNTFPFCSVSTEVQLTLSLFSSYSRNGLEDVNHSGFFALAITMSKYWAGRGKRKMSKRGKGREERKERREEKNLSPFGVVSEIGQTVMMSASSSLPLSLSLSLSLSIIQPGVNKLVRGIGEEKETLSHR